MAKTYFFYHGIFLTHILLESILALYKIQFCTLSKKILPINSNLSNIRKTFQLSSLKTHRYLSNILLNRTKYGFQKQNGEKHIYIKKSRYCQSNDLFSKNEKCQRMLFSLGCLLYVIRFREL